MGYPRSINLGAQTYEVSVERDSEGSIQYFQLLDSQGEIFFEGVREWCCATAGGVGGKGMFEREGRQ